jgi:hypothetical protein
LPQAASVTSDAPDSAAFGRTLVRVMTVQVIALGLLWLLQWRYSG